MTTHGSARAEVEQHQSPPRVLLIDSENFFGTISPRPRLLRARLAALLTAAGPVHHAVAAFATTSETGDPLASLLAEHRVASLTVAPSPDAAEDALLAHARRVHDSLGRCCWLVASADHRLAALAELGRIEVLAWEGQPVADRLTNVAHATHRLARPDSATGAFPEPAPVPSPHRRRCPELLRAVGYTILTGVGIGIGQHLTVRLLGRRRR
ncbi:hypothetical protein [Amycolatopsis tolypomycina]|uniref:hypothetical protein n=1 Tax=Amycolatopsis tolypomycina TaxID=208445 RepID=UPI0033A0873B